VIDRPPSFHFNTSDTELSVQGFKVGKIDGLGASYYEDYHSTDPDDAVVQPSGLINGYGSDKDLLVAVWQTLTGNRDPGGRPAPGTYQCLLQCALRLEDHNPSAEALRGQKAFNNLMGRTGT
jgi:hypothetical protein